MATAKHQRRLKIIVGNHQNWGVGWNSFSKDFSEEESVFLNNTLILSVKLLKEWGKHYPHNTSGLGYVLSHEVGHAWDGLVHPDDVGFERCKNHLTIMSQGSCPKTLPSLGEWDKKIKKIIMKKAGR